MECIQFVNASIRMYLDQNMLLITLHCVSTLCEICKIDMQYCVLESLEEIRPNMECGYLSPYIFGCMCCGVGIYVQVAIFRALLEFITRRCLWSLLMLSVCLSDSSFIILDIHIYRLISYIPYTIWIKTLFWVNHKQKTYCLAYTIDITIVIWSC